MAPNLEWNDVGKTGTLVRLVNEAIKRTSHKIAGSQSTTLFGDHPFFIKHPQDNFSLQNVNWRPPNRKLTPSKKGLATSNLQFLYRNTQKSPLANLYFGGRQFALWRLKLSWGCFIEKGGPPKSFIEKGGPQKGWYFRLSPQKFWVAPLQNEIAKQVSNSKMRTGTKKSRSATKLAR